MAASGTTTQTAATAADARRAADERELTDLIQRAARLTDQRRFREWVDLFARDGVYCAITLANLNGKGLYLYYDAGYHAIQERAAYLDGVWRVPRGKTLHTVSNIEFDEITPAAAAGSSYFVIYRTGEQQHSRLHACGEYRDRYVRVDGRWRFAERTVVLDTDLLPAEFTELL
jgi:3-phenylpropionate/cinnamic acid dioxygenase small subunit